ncbi:MAG: chemotaxis protein [Paucimonas sp.]|nr:chemotaxis protein [Paucimonas sp.]
MQDESNRIAIETDLLLEALNRYYGEDLRKEDRAALAPAIAQAMARHNAATISGLLEKVMHDEAVADALLRSLVSATALMFADSGYQRQVHETVGPLLRSFATPNAWLSQCGSTEQLLSLLVTLEEDQVLDKTTVYVTHRSARRLAQVREGRISMSRIAQHEEMYRRAGGRHTLSRYGSANDGYLEFSQRLLDRVVWSEYNIATDTSFNEFQWIEASESLRLLEPPVRRRALAVYHSSLHHFGVLGLGQELAELPLAEAWRPLAPGSALYRRS